MTIFIGSGGVKLDYLGAACADVASSMTHTFTGVNFGASSPTGELTVFGAATIGALAQLDSVVVDGVPATLVTKVVGFSRTAGLFQIAGESGSGSVQITTSNPCTVFHLSAWKLRGLQITTAHDTDSYSSTPPAIPAPAIALDIPKLGVGIGFAIADLSGPGIAWTGLDKNFEQTSGVNNYSTGASKRFDTAQVGLAVTTTPTATGAVRFVGASWR